MACVQNFYNIASRADAAVLAATAGQHIAYVPYFPLGGFSPLQSDVLESAAKRLGAIPAAIAPHNSFELNVDAPCGRPVINETPVWSAVDARCAAKSAAKYQPMYQKLYSQIAAWRDGKPTILRTINRYSDWIGFA